MSGANMKTMPASRSARCHHRDRRVDRDAERLEHVGAAALRGERAVAVLRDAHARARDDERRRRRDVEGVDRPAAGAAGVDQLVRRSAGSTTIARRSARTTAASSAGVSPLTRSPMSSAGDLRRRGVAGEHDVERRGQLLRIGALRPCVSRRTVREQRVRRGLADTERFDESFGQPRVRRDERDDEAEQPHAVDVLFDEHALHGAIREVHHARPARRGRRAES